MIESPKTGLLGYEPAEIARYFPSFADARAELLEKNFAQDLFVSNDLVEREIDARLVAILNPPIVVTTVKDDQELEDAFPT